MPKLPVISGRDVIKTLEKLGFEPLRQRGSHITMRRGNVGCVVPLHREGDRGTLQSILKQAGVTAQPFLDAVP